MKIFSAIELFLASVFIISRHIFVLTDMPENSTDLISPATDLLKNVTRFEIRLYDEDMVNIQQIHAVLSKKKGKKLTAAAAIRAALDQYANFLGSQDETDIAAAFVKGMAKMKIECDMKIQEMKDMPKTEEECIVEYLKAHPEDMKKYIQAKYIPQSTQPRTMKDMMMEYEEMRKMFESDTPKKSTTDVLIESFADAWKNPEIKAGIIKELKEIVHPAPQTEVASRPRLLKPKQEEELQRNIYEPYIPSTEED